MRIASVVGGVTIGVLCLGGVPAFAQDGSPMTTKQPEKTKEKSYDQDKKKDKKESSDKINAGSVAPAFAAPDTDGKTHSLAEATKEGKIVVLQWFNAGCPWVKMHYGAKANTFNDLHAKYASKGVQFYAVASNAPGTQGSGKDFNAKAKTDWKMPYPILLDESGTIGRSYNAANTPLMVIIGKDGKVAYYGAIDDASETDAPGKTNYVAKALDEMLAGTNVTVPSTKPYGCSVKYAEKPMKEKTSPTEKTKDGEKK
ncbi:MAG: thioredoxin family protein [Planctomycetota bacterium]|nr:thioredoxin family protein [Planctomycetota bacterium]